MERNGCWESKKANDPLGHSSGKLCSACMKLTIFFFSFYSPTNMIVFNSIWHWWSSSSSTSTPPPFDNSVKWISTIESQLGVAGGWLWQDWIIRSHWKGLVGLQPQRTWAETLERDDWESKKAHCSLACVEGNWLMDDDFFYENIKICLLSSVFGKHFYSSFIFKLFSS